MAIRLLRTSPWKKNRGYPKLEFKQNTETTNQQGRAKYHAEQKFFLELARGERQSVYSPAAEVVTPSPVISSRSAVVSGKLLTSLFAWEAVGKTAAGEAVGDAFGEVTREADKEISEEVGGRAGEEAGETVGKASGEISGEAAGETARDVAGEAVGETAGEATGCS